MESSDQPEIVIAGGGTAGLTAALAIARSAPELPVEIVDCQAARINRRR
jgi:2-polyprenyl-6-methoxyphenol hydroxylase-like FAD-dependent oxidoreductase